MEKRRLCVSFLLCIFLGFWSASYFRFCTKIASGALLNVNINPYPIHSFASSDQMERTVCVCAFGLFQIKFTHHLHSRSLLLRLSPCHAFLHFQITKATTTTGLMHADFCFMKFLLKFNFQRRHFRGGL